MEEEVMAGSCSSQAPLRPIRYDLLRPPVAPTAPAPEPRRPAAASARRGPPTPEPRRWPAARQGRHPSPPPARQLPLLPPCSSRPPPLPAEIFAGLVAFVAAAIMVFFLGRCGGLPGSS
ncbi:Os05g0198150 [Oryza sativa Japonica Group]|uniref:Os05g0198150 protein n=1 Tax=Oryza sativa subsp. japonica TaxID=39947 RepID=A0A0P0WJ31_ORYSJ|nr:Os05g0198150 [Oryza sativa Japonica Group]